MDGTWWLQLTGLAGGFLLALRAWRRMGEPLETAVHLLVSGAVALFLGSRLLYWLERGGSADLLDPRVPGYSGFGGLVLVLAFWLALSRVIPFPVWRFFDAVTPAAAFGLTFGRMACFTRGCCGGIPADLPWAVQFAPGTQLYSRQLTDALIPPGCPLSLPVHPTQLYEAAFALGAWLLLARLLDRRVFRNGIVFAWGMIAYGVFRFFVEFLRQDATAGVRFLELSLAQWVSLVLVLAGSGLILAFRPTGADAPVSRRR